MGVSKMTGTPWHVERFIREDGDDRRHRSRCIYYQKSDAHCNQYSGKCRGSAHCAYYREYDPDAEMGTEPKPAVKKPEIPKWEGKRMFPAGCRVRHKSFGTGIVLEVTEGRVKVKFDSGKETILGLDMCVKNKLMVREES